jgi:hypothetical protein
MAGKEQVHDLMSAIGPMLELLEVTEFDEENLWTLVVDEDTVLFADYGAEEGRLVLSTELGAPPGGERHGLYELLLTYNNQWGETGGVRMALDAPGGNVVQIYDLALAGLDLPRFQTVVGNFVDTARAWREIVAKGGDGGGDSPAGPIDPFMSGMIRG